MFTRHTLPCLVVAAFLGMATTAWSLSRPASRAWFAQADAPAAGTGHPDRERPVRPAPKPFTTNVRPLPPRRAESSAADIAFRMAETTRRLDRRFVGEPLDAALAARRERAIHNFFISHRDLANDVGNTCHSSTCRVTAHYADAIAAEQAMQQLALQLADDLPYGAVMPRQLADGSIEVDAWYSSSPLTL